MAHPTVDSQKPITLRESNQNFGAKVYGCWRGLRCGAHKPQAVIAVVGEVVAADEVLYLVV